MPSQRLVLPVEGMECGACASAVERRLRDTAGVMRVSVNFAMGTAVVEVTDDADVGLAIVQALREIGFDCGRSSIALHVPGLRDEADLTRIEAILGDVPGVLAVRINRVTEILELDYLPGSATLKSYQFLLEQIGFPSADVVMNGVMDPRTLPSADEARTLLWRLLAAAGTWLITFVLTLPLAAEGAVGVFGRLAEAMTGPARSFAPSLFETGAMALRAGAIAVTLGAIVFIARHDWRRAWLAARRHAADRHTLVALGLVGTWLLASVAAFAAPGTTELAFPALHAALMFVLFARWVEYRLLARLGEDLVPLDEVLPPKAHVERDGTEQDVVRLDLCAGDRLVVKPGETIPVDGVVISGESDVNESRFTGDELPVTKKRGDPVYAGTLNGRGTFAVEATAVGRETGLAQLLRAVSAAELGAVRDNAVARRWSRWQAPWTIAVALVTGGVWFALGSDVAVTLAVAGFSGVLFVSAPAALALAVPITFIEALHQVARRGIIVRLGETLEQLARIDTVVFDKSGTLTRGHLTVTHVLGAERSDGQTVSPSEILRLAAAVESRSRHAVGRAVVESARGRNIDIAPVDRFVEMSGRGVRGVVGRFLVEVISVAHARERNHDLGSLSRRAEKHVLQGRQPVVVVVNDTVQGLIILGDEMRPSARRTVDRLRTLGVDVVMLSGDSRAGAGLAAKEIGIDRVLAEVSPDRKGEEVARLQWDGRSVAAVGDGLRDAEALAAALVGISFGAGGQVDEAGADATIINEDLSLVPYAIELARATVRAARTNLRFVFAYHALGIPLAAGVLYPLTGLVAGPALAAMLAAVCMGAVGSKSFAIRRFAPAEAAHAEQTG